MKFTFSIPYLIKARGMNMDQVNFWKAFMQLLPSGGKILEHYDGGLGFTLSHRIHVPIKTNKNVLFSVDGEKRELNQGEIIEINNLKDHFVENNDPNEDRIHLIMDFVTVEYMHDTMKKALVTFDINYDKRITDITIPFMESYSKKIGGNS